MFAYCNNNPVNLVDPSGTCGYIYSIYFWSDCGKEYCEYKLQKKYPEECSVLSGESNSYKNIPVIKVNSGTASFSFGAIFLGKENDISIDSIRLLQHEYGHILQLLETGALGYMTFVVIPSVATFALDVNEWFGMDYYDMPWEHVANSKANVPWGSGSADAQERATKYWQYVIKASEHLNEVEFFKP